MPQTLGNKLNLVPNSHTFDIWFRVFVIKNRQIVYIESVWKVNAVEQCDLSS